MKLSSNKSPRLLWSRCCSTRTPAAVDDAAAGPEGIEFVRQALDKLQAPHRASYATLLKRCINLKALIEGKLVHGRIKEQGLDGDPYLCNWLVQLYGTCGCLPQANAAFESNLQRNEYTWTILLGAYAQNQQLTGAARVFQSMPHRNVVSWNSMIAAYAQNGENRKAIVIYSRMNLEGVEASELTLLAVLDACAGPEFLAAARSAHDRAVQSGFMANAKVRNAVISMYGKCACVEDAKRTFESMQEVEIVSWNSMVAVYGQNEHLEDAKQAFDKMPAWSVISWNAMSAAYAQNGEGQRVLELFTEMEERGFEANVVTFVIAIDVCAGESLLAEGKSIHDKLVHRHLDSHTTVATLLVKMYGKCGCPEEARAVFDATPQRNVVSWNSMVSAYVQNGWCKEAVELFRAMDIEGLKVDTITLMTIADSCSLAEAKTIYNSIVYEELEDDVVVRTAFMSAFGKCNSAEDAMQVFLEMPCRSVVSWNSMMSVLIANGRGPEKAFELFQNMDIEGFQATVVTLVTILEGCASLPPKFGKQVHVAVRDSPLYLDVFVGCSLINVHGKCKSPDSAKLLFDELRGYRNVVSFTALFSAFYQNDRLEEARDVFEKMPQRSLISWNAMLAALAQDGHNEQAMRLFREILEQGIEPDYGSYTSILESADPLPLEFVKFLHYSAAATGYHEYESVLSVLVKAYVRCASLSDASEAFGRLPRDSVASWNVIIGALVQSGYLRQALNLFKSMDLEGVQPSNATYLSVVDACAQLGNKATDMGRDIHSGMDSTSLETDVMLCNALLNMYAKCGCLAEARAVFDRMQFRSSVSWTSFMTACGVTGHSRETLELFQRMNLDGMEPDSIAFVCVLSSLSHAGEMNRCLNSFLDMQADFGLQPAVVHLVCIVDLLGRAGKLDLAEQLVQCIPLEPHAWMALLSACKTQGKNVPSAEMALDSMPEAANLYVLLSNVYASSG